MEYSFPHALYFLGNLLVNVTLYWVNGYKKWKDRVSPSLYSHLYLLQSNALLVCSLGQIRYCSRLPLTFTFNSFNRYFQYKATYN